MRGYRTALVISVMAIASGAQATQQATHQMGGAAMAPAQDAALVSACVASQQQAAALADGLTRQLEFVRQTNAPADMRIAMDGLQAALVEMRTALRKCDPLSAAAAAADAQVGHNMRNMQPSGLAGSPTPVMNHGGTTAAPGAMPGMDHSKMAMGTTAAKPVVAGSAKPAGSMAGMDHSKRGTGSTAATPSAPAGRKPAAAMAGMDHSDMPMTGTAAKPNAPAAAKPADPMTGMDHSKMGSNAAPKAGDHGGTSGTAKLPVTMAERVADPACPSNVGHADAATAVYQKKVYYFCSTADRDRFRKDPAAYLKKQPR